MNDELRAYLEEMERRLREQQNDMERRLSEHFDERLHDTETRLLRAFADYHTGWDNRFRRIETSDATLAERMAALENRVLRLETSPRQ